MKNNAILLVSMALLFTACNNAGKEVVSADSPKDSAVVVNEVTTPVIDTSISGCYSMIWKRDTATLQLEVKGANITGPLSYNNFQKDRNDGSFTGELRADVLSGWYLFRSEGMMSIRQVSWKIRAGRLWEGHGEMKERNDSALFVNPDKLIYDSTRAFVKIKCVI